MEREVRRRFARRKCGGNWGDEPCWGMGEELAEGMGAEIGTVAGGGGGDGIGGGRYCCLNGKERFGSRREALFAARAMNERGKGLPSIYWCTRCNAYHLTHYDYGRSKNLRQCIERETQTKNRTKKKRNMKIIIDNAYVPDGTVVGIHKLDDGGEQLQVVTFDVDDRKMDVRYTYSQALELVEAIKLQLSRMTTPDINFKV